ncbi:PTS sugar transporter subunit IIB [Eubacteriales bacterium OttesenSCG-928-N14]|nr:PTS sugar transporter subunit IIB [Eubacteriales bacterium OttesenSCG-928-N14]
MSNIRYVRIDNRYVHGQVAARLVREYSITKVILINDAYAKDVFMSQLFKSVAFSGSTVDVVSVEDAVAGWNAGNYEKETVMLLWGNVVDAHRTFMSGLKYEFLNVGNLGGGPGRERVNKSTYIDAQDAAQLKELADAGVEVYFQDMPDLPRTDLDEALKITQF